MPNNWTDYINNYGTDQDVPIDTFDIYTGCQLAFPAWVFTRAHHYATVEEVGVFFKTCLWLYGLGWMQTSAETETPYIKAGLDRLVTQTNANTIVAAFDNDASKVTDPLVAEIILNGVINE